MGCDEQRAGASPEVLLQPLEGAEVQVVRRLVEEEQVRRGDHEPRQRGPRLLPAGQRGRRSAHVVAGAKPRPDSASSTRWSSV